MNDTYLKSKKILIVDDEECLRSMLITILEDENFLNIITADCVKIALEICQQEKPDIAILDVMLPDGNGFELMETLRSFTNIPVIFLTSGTFDLLTLVKYTGYCFVSTLPVLAFMLLVSSRCENIWFTLGIGVAGFFSGMAMSLSDIAIFLINPFVLMMKPAVASTASIDMKVLILGFVETIIFFMVGWYLGKIKHYE